MSESSPADHLNRAIIIAGSQAALARRCGVAQPGISRALRRGRVSAALACKIDRATGGEVSRADLCPEIFGLNLYQGGRR
jgi:DNA-binding transcriptional regulator YdaS (Cro superfamily)